MSISDKVSLYARVLIIGVLIMGLLATLSVPAIETKVTILSAIVTSVTLLYLVSENLKGSAVRKLDYWNRKVLTPLLGISNQLIQFENPGRAKALDRYRYLLKKWGKIGFVKLYPKGFLSTLAMMKEHTDTYDQIYEKIRLAGEKSLGKSYARVSLFYATDIGEGENATADIIVKHKEFLDALKKEDPKLFEQFQTAIKFFQDDSARLKAEIEKFYIENQLEPVKETALTKPVHPFDLF